MAVARKFTLFIAFVRLVFLIANAIRLLLRMPGSVLRQSSYFMDMIGLVPCACHRTLQSNDSSPRAIQITEAKALVIFQFVAECSRHIRSELFTMKWLLKIISWLTRFTSIRTIYDGGRALQM